MATKPLVVSTTEAATILGVSDTTVRRMLKRGQLKGFLSQGLGRITIASLEELLGETIQSTVEEPADTATINMEDGEDVS